MGGRDRRRDASWPAGSLALYRGDYQAAAPRMHLRAEVTDLRVEVAAQLANRLGQPALEPAPGDLDHDVALKAVA